MTGGTLYEKFKDLLATLLADGGSSMQALVEQLTQPWTDFVKAVDDFAKVIPADPNDLFFNDDADRTADQISLDEFCTAVGEATVQAWNPPDSHRGTRRTEALAALTAPSAATVAAAFRALLKALKPFIDPEFFVRWTMNLRGHLNKDAVVAECARFSADVLVGEQMLNSLQWDEEVPSDDDDKAAEENLGNIVPESWRGLANRAGSLIPGSSSSTELGKRHHKHIMSLYARQHPDHVVVCDGRMYLQGRDFRVSRALADPPSTLTDQRVIERLRTFRNSMKNPQGNRIRPDIADLADTATGTDPSQDWGWFEIKRMTSLGDAYVELYGYYMLTWNQAHDLVGDPAGRAQAGVWFPQLLSFDGHDPTKYFLVTINLGGPLGYLVFEVQAAAEAALLTIAVGLMSQFAKGLFKKVGKLVEDTGKLIAAVFADLLVVAIVAVLAVIVLAGGEMIAIGAAVLAQVAAALVAVLPELAALIALLGRATTD